MVNQGSPPGFVCIFEMLRMKHGIHKCPQTPTNLLNLLPSLLPKQPSLVPCPEPRVQLNLHPSLQLENPFQWPLLSMCCSSKSNTRAKKSGTQSLSLNRAEYASQQAVSGSFCGSYALVFACFASCHASFVYPPGQGEGTVIWVCFPGVVRILLRTGSCYSRGGRVVSKADMQRCS